MNSTKTLIPAALLVGLSLAALPASAQDRGRDARGHNSGNNGRVAAQSSPRSSGAPAASARQSAPQSSSPRQVAPRANVQPQYNGGNRYQVAPRANVQPQYNGGNRYQVAPRANVQPQYNGGNRYQVAPRANVQPQYNGGNRYQVAPRANVPSQYNGNRYQAAPRAYAQPGYGGGRSYGYGGSRGVYGYLPAYRDYHRIEGYRPFFFGRPYYSFRPRLNIGFGIWLGFGVPYPYSWLSGYPSVYGYYNGAFNVVPNATSYGGVSFYISPENAEVYVDGTYVGIVSDFGPNAQPLTLVPGPHRVEVQADGYQPMTWDVDVVPGQVIPFQGALQPYGPGAQQPYGPGAPQPYQR